MTPANLAPLMSALVGLDTFFGSNGTWWILLRVQGRRDISPND